MRYEGDFVVVEKKFQVQSWNTDDSSYIYIFFKKKFITTHVSPVSGHGEPPGTPGRLKGGGRGQLIDRTHAVCTKR